MGGMRPYNPGNRGDDSDDLQSPEALLISAFLEHGQFEPERHFITSDDIAGWGKLWAFCADYQKKAGKAPPMSLVATMFPEFEITGDVDVAWAASKVREDAAFRDMRHRSRAMLAAVNEGDLHGAYSAFDGLQRPREHRLDPVSVFDHSVLTEEFDVGGIEVPFATLQRASNGGIRAAEYWLLAARLGQGKTHIALTFAAHAAKVGCRVGMMALEMPARQVNRRLIRCMAGRDVRLLGQLDSEDEYERKKAIDHIRELTPGVVEVFDPSRGRVNTTSFLHEMCRDYDLVIVDHLGLMQTAENKRAIEDWRVMSTISNTVRETTLSTNTPVLALAQINREGESRRGDSTRPPRASQLSQSDALGQDADAVITMRRPSTHTMRYEAVKLREGPNVKWYSRFDPERARFEEITHDQYEEISISDASREAFDD